jgi:cytochrome c553
VKREGRGNRKGATGAIGHRETVAVLSSRFSREIDEEETSNSGLTSEPKGGPVKHEARFERPGNRNQIAAFRSDRKSFQGETAMKKLTMAIMMVAIVAAVPVFAGEWHAGNTNVCTDCHTMHFSMQHSWNGGAVSTTGTANGNWLSTSGPNEFLLKAPPNQLCLSCHDGQTFAPDVLYNNTNPSPSGGREAGALNQQASASAPYENWKGHTLDSTSQPPGFNPTSAGVPVSSQYDPSQGLSCISCHLQHGSATVYRNLGPRSAAFQPTYVLGTTNDTTKDVWINIPSPYTPNTGVATTFNPLYAYNSVSFNRTDPAVPAGATTQTSNRMDTFCSACHGDFHGGTGDTNIGGGTVGANADGFIRHPTSKQVIGSATAGGHSALSRYTGATTKIHVYASDRAGFTDATPGCVTCHKAHGNQNPFGLFFLSRNVTGGTAAITEQGGYNTSDPPEMANGYGIGYREMCGQCHSQGG